MTWLFTRPRTVVAATKKPKVRITDLASTNLVEVPSPTPTVPPPTCYRCSDPRNCRGYTEDPGAACYLDTVENA
jgi:hypothetical protein